MEPSCKDGSWQVRWFSASPPAVCCTQVDPGLLLTFSCARPLLLPCARLVLFAIFLLITIAWDVLVGVLTFLNNILRGRKANWLSRVKEELLALGVVSLVLLFVEVRFQRPDMHVRASCSARDADLEVDDDDPCVGGVQVFSSRIVRCREAWGQCTTVHCAAPTMLHERCMLPLLGTLWL